MMGYDEFDLFDDPAAAGTIESTGADVGEFWVEYANTQSDRFSMLVIMFGLVMGLLICLILKQR